MSSSIHTKEERWRESIKKAQAGDKMARDTLVTENAGLVYMVLKRFQNRGYEMEDLFQIGMIGLLKAVDKFDVSTEYSFSTYAVPMIIGEIRRFLRDDGIIHISRQVKDNARKIAIAKEELKKTTNCDPTMEQLMACTGLGAEEILLAIEATKEVDSIYRPVKGLADTDGAQLMLADQLEDKKETEEDLINKITIGQMLSGLQEKERLLIQLRYMEGKTQSESACILGMNQVAVSRLEKKILLYLRGQF